MLFSNPRRGRRFIFINLSLACLVLHSCANDSSKSSQDVSDTVAATADPGENVAPSQSCYRMTDNRDTAHLKLSVTDSFATGHLEYNRFEKDRNRGTLKGIVRNGVLIADYNFQSEGMTSVREVVFSLKGDSIFEGYGPIKVSGDTARFVDVGNLKFMTTPFIKVPCNGR